MSAAQILDHDAEARALLLEQYKGLPNIQAVVDAYCADVQDLENALWSVRTGIDVFNAIGVQLDQLGEILNAPRTGQADTAYRGILLAKVAQNVSQGTPEDVIKVFKLLMSASYVEYLENDTGEVCSFRITAVGATPVTDIASIKHAIQETKALGTTVTFYASAPGVAFSFLGDPDPTGQGFENINDLTTGGYFASIF